MKVTKRHQNGESVVTVTEKRPKLEEEGHHQDLLVGGVEESAKNGHQENRRCPICLWPLNSPYCYHANKNSTTNT